MLGCVEYWLLQEESKNNLCPEEIYILMENSINIKQTMQDKYRVDGR